MSAPSRKPRAVPDGEPDPNPDRIELIEIDGMSYTVPRVVRANLLIKYMLLRKNYGVDSALLTIIDDLAGPALVPALIGHDALTLDELTDVFDTVRTLLTDREVKAKGN